MLRFGSSPTTKPRSSNRERWRMWLLVFVSGLVIVTMRKLNQPATIEKLDQILERPVPAGVTAPRTPFATGVDLSGIEDNTYFRPEEQETWFELFARLRELGPQQLAAATLGELTYAQLLQQPDVYRGQLVTLQGTVLREEQQYPGENSLGIARYHRLWLRPSGGGHWPFVVYALDLPEQFPRGDNLRVEVRVTGYFFKNWSYKYDDGLGLAPVVLANGIDWQRPATPAPQPQVRVREILWMMGGAGLFALVCLWFIVRNSARKPQSSAELPDRITLPVEWAAETSSGER